MRLSSERTVNASLVANSRLPTIVAVMSPSASTVISEPELRKTEPDVVLKVMSLVLAENSRRLAAANEMDEPDCAWKVAPALKEKVTRKRSRAPPLAQ